MTAVKKITFLGTGTSHGIPVIACDCPVCCSDDPRNKRLRTSLLIALDNGKNIIIDTSVDFRQQCLSHDIRHVDAVLFTHCHADHVFGLDDIRRFNQLQQAVIPCYAQAHVVKELRRIFGYAFGEALQMGGGLPSLELNTVGGPFEACGLAVIPLRVMHGVAKVTAFRFGNIAYVTDCSAIPEESIAQLTGLDVLILDALRERKHPTHFNLEEAIAMAQRLKARKTYFTHVAHQLDHEQTNRRLPEGMALAYDGLIISR